MRLQTTVSTISALIKSVVRRQAVGLADHLYLLPVDDAWSCGNDRHLRDGHRQLDVFLSPAHRGRLLQSVIFIFIFMGAMAGNVAAKVSKIWNSEEQE